MFGVDITVSEGVLASAVQILLILSYFQLLRHFWCIRMIIPPLSSLSSSTDELRQGAKQLSRGVEQYYLSTEVSLLVSVWFG